MGKNIEAYRKYLKKQEMLGVKTFGFEINVGKDEVYIVKYITNKETERLIKIPDFVYRVRRATFKDVCQNINIVGGGQNLRFIYVNDFKGNTIDIHNIDTSNVEYMEFMFSGCANLKELDLSNFSTSKVKTMNYMFNSCTSLEKLDLSNFDTRNVKSMYGMFGDCNNLKELDLSNFDTSNVESIVRMFDGCRNLKKLDLSNFDTSNIRYMNSMFDGCESLELIVTNKNTKDWLMRHSQDIDLPKGVKIVEK